MGVVTKTERIVQMFVLGRSRQFIQRRLGIPQVEIDAALRRALIAAHEQMKK